VRSDRVLEVLDLVGAIPPGRVMSYGDVARHVGLASPRQVGQIMARHGHEVPWHRVVMADGSPAPHEPREHLARLRSERVPILAGRVDMTRARWRPRGTVGPTRP
jgi:methylated-DNA-protein-cysteine methyltransferase related protein